MTGLDVFPKALALEVLACLYRVHGPLPLHREEQEAHGPRQNRAGRWAAVVFVAEKIEDQGAEAEHDGG
jgi:hypothetical protein